MLVYVGKKHVWERTDGTLILFCQLGFGIACLFQSEHMLFCQLGLLWVVGLPVSSHIVFRTVVILRSQSSSFCFGTRPQ